MNNGNLSFVIILSVAFAALFAILWFYSKRKSIKTPEEIKEEIVIEEISHLKKGLIKARTSFVHALESLLDTSKEINVRDTLEEILIMADVGTKTTSEILNKIKPSENVISELKTALLEIIKKPGISKFHEIAKKPQNKPHVIFFVGVNGVGKTTTLGKIANQLALNGHKVVIGAADTFRAAAIEQLEVWATRAGAEIIKQKQNADPASVIFDAITAGKSRGADFVLIDTAGRLHTKQNLMEELKKLDRVAKKVIEDAPHDVFLVLDGSTGQNANVQSKIFSECMPVTGLIMTKLDGTSKGGTLVGIVNELNIPPVYIGVGEKIEDLMHFDAEEYVSALLDSDGLED